MTITQVTTFPASLGLPGGNQITATGTNGTELKNSLVTQLNAKLATAQQQQQAVTDALTAVNN